MDKVRALRYFLKVAETSSFTLAAKSFSVPASSVSRRIRDLESELKVELFHRSTRVVKLSTLGQIYYEQVKDIIFDLDSADEIVSQRSECPSGILRITAMPSYGRLVLQPVLERMRLTYPEIILDVELTDHVSDITRNEVDIAIRGTSVLPERAVAKKLSNNQFVMVASPEYLARTSVPMTSDDLHRHQTLHYRGPNGVFQWQTQTEGKWREIRTNPVYVTNNGTALVQAVVNGQGIGLLPKWGISKELERGELQLLEFKEERVSITRDSDSGIYLLYLRPRYGILKIKVAVDFLVAELSNAN